jgi:hypothetical protein
MLKKPSNGIFFYGCCKDIVCRQMKKKRLQRICFKVSHAINLQNLDEKRDLWTKYILATWNNIATMLFTRRLMNAVMESQELSGQVKTQTAALESELGAVRAARDKVIRK